MAKEQNPFTSFLDSWAADPEGEAKGRVYSETGRLKSEEANRIASLNQVRGLIMNDKSVPDIVKWSALANENMNPVQLQDAISRHGGNRAIFNFGQNGQMTPRTNITPQEFGIASLALGNAPNSQITQGLSGTFDKAPTGKIDTVQYGGNIFEVNKDSQTGKTSLIPLTTFAEESKQGSALGQTATTVTNTPIVNKDGTISIKSGIQAAAMQGGMGIPARELAAIKQQRFKSDAVTLGASAVAHPYGVYGYLMDRRLGRLLPNGKPNSEIPGLNPYQFNILEQRAKEYEKAGYVPTDAFEAALSDMPDIKSGDFETKEFGNSFLRTAAESDVNDNELPNYGGGDFLATKGFAYKDKSGNLIQHYQRKPGQVVVPFEQNVMSNANKEDLASSVLSGSVLPRMAEELPSNGLIENGALYHHQGRYYIGRMGANGKVVPEEIMNRNQ